MSASGRAIVYVSVWLQVWWRWCDVFADDEVPSGEASCGVAGAWPSLPTVVEY